MSQKCVYTVNTVYSWISAFWKGRGHLFEVIWQILLSVWRQSMKILVIEMNGSWQSITLKIFILMFSLSSCTENIQLWCLLQDTCFIEFCHYSFCEGAFVKEYTVLGLYFSEYNMSSLQPTLNYITKLDTHINNKHFGYHVKWNKKTKFILCFDIDLISLSLLQF